MSFFHEINVTELRDGITSLHGIHAYHSKVYPLLCLLAISHAALLLLLGYYWEAIEN